MSFENTVHLYSQQTNAATVIFFIGYIIVFMSQVRATGFGLNLRHMLGCKISSIYMIHQMKRQHSLDISSTNEHQAVMEKLHCNVYAVKFTVRTQRETTPFVVII